MDLRKRAHNAETLELIAKCDDVIGGLQQANAAANAEIQALKAKAEKMRLDVLASKPKEVRYAQIKAALANPASLVKYFPDLSQSALIEFAKKELLE